MWNLSFLTRGWTCVPFIGRPILNHRITRKVPRSASLEGINNFLPSHAPLKYTALEIFWQTGHSFAFYSYTLFEDLNCFYQKLGWRTGLQSPWQPIQGNQTLAWVLCLAWGPAYGFGKEVFAVAGSQSAVPSSFVSYSMWTWKWSLWNNWASKRWGWGGGQVDLICAWPACPLGRVTVSRLSLCHLQCTHLRMDLGSLRSKSCFRVRAECWLPCSCPGVSIDPTSQMDIVTWRLQSPWLPTPLLHPSALKGPRGHAKSGWSCLSLSLNLSLFSLYAHIDTHRHIDTHTEFKPPLKITSPPEQVLLLSVHLLLPLFLVTVSVAAFSEILPVFMTKWLQRCWGVRRQVLLYGFHQVRFYLKRLFTKDSHSNGQKRACVL